MLLLRASRSSDPPGAPPLNAGVVALVVGCAVALGVARGAAAQESPPPDPPPAGTGNAEADPATHAPDDPQDATSENGSRADDHGLSPEQADRLSFLTNVMRGPGTAPALRAETAARLLGMRVAPATALLDELLRTNDPAMVTAVASAIDEVGDPEAALIEGCALALRTAANGLVDSIAKAMRAYGDKGYATVRAIALDSSLPPGERLGAVRALGRFFRRDAIGDLVALANDTADDGAVEPERIRVAAMHALARLSPEDFGLDFAAWKSWWETVRTSSQDEWTYYFIEGQQDRNTELEMQLDRLGKRLVAVLRRLYRSLQVPEVFDQLALDLADPLPNVRFLALDYLRILVQDSTPLPDEIQTLVLARVEDEDPQVRRFALDVLDQLAHAELPARLASRLAIETDRTVVDRILDVLTRRPAPAALDSVLSWLPDPELGAKAIAALWTLVHNVEFSAERQEQIRIAVRTQYDAQPTPALARVLARIGKTEDVAELTTYLDGPDDAYCKAVAEGLLEHGEVQRLYDRSSDPRVEPFAIDALARGAAELQNFQRLATMSVRPESLARWSAAVRDLARRLPASDIVAADDILQADGRADIVQRSIVLSEVATRTENVPAEQRIAVLKRLVPMLLQQGEAQMALELLESANGDHPDLAPLRFEAALTVGRFDLAAQLKSEPAPWIATLRVVASRDETAARRIRDEITARFGSVLTEEDRRTLDGLDGVLGDAGG